MSLKDDMKRHINQRRKYWKAKEALGTRSPAIATALRELELMDIEISLSSARPAGLIHSRRFTPRKSARIR